MFRFHFATRNTTTLNRTTAGLIGCQHESCVDYRRAGGSRRKALAYIIQTVPGTTPYRKLTFACGPHLRSVKIQRARGGRDYRGLTISENRDLGWVTFDVERAIEQETNAAERAERAFRAAEEARVEAERPALMNAYLREVEGNHIPLINVNAADAYGRRTVSVTHVFRGQNAMGPAELREFSRRLSALAADLETMYDSDGRITETGRTAEFDSFGQVREPVVSINLASVARDSNARFTTFAVALANEARSIREERAPRVGA